MTEDNNGKTQRCFYAPDASNRVVALFVALGEQSPSRPPRKLDASRSTQESEIDPIVC